MTAEAAIKTALESLGVPVGRLTFRGNANTFITYQLVISAERDFSDDENAAEEYTYRIDLFFPRGLYRFIAKREAGIESGGLLRDRSGSGGLRTGYKIFSCANYGEIS